MKMMSCKYVQLFFSFFWYYSMLMTVNNNYLNFKQMLKSMEYEWGLFCGLKCTQWNKMLVFGYKTIKMFMKFNNFMKIWRVFIKAVKPLEFSLLKLHNISHMFNTNISPNYLNRHLDGKNFLNALSPFKWLEKW